MSSFYSLKYALFLEHHLGFNAHMTMTSRCGFVSIAIASAALLANATAAAAQHGATNGEWRSYGGDNGSTKYSPLDQIDADNFSHLEIAWRAETPDARLDLEAIVREQERRGRRGESPSANAAYGVSIRLFKATPLMVDGLLYVSTPLSQAAAFDAGTGEMRWVHDPETISTDRPPAGPTHVGLPTGATETWPESIGARPTGIS